MVQATARALAYLCKLFSLLYGLTALYAAIALLLFGPLGKEWAPVQIVEGNLFYVLLPVINKPFFGGDYTTSFITSLFIMMVFYTIYAWLFGNFLMLFAADNPFTLETLDRSKRFCIITFTVPLVIILAILLINSDVFDLYPIVLFHIAVGIFSFLTYGLLKKAVLKLNEYELN